MKGLLALCFCFVGIAALYAQTAPATYKEENVTFGNGPITLAGTLTIPAGAGPFPAVVMVTGSGAQNRDEELFGFKPFAVIAADFARRGIATLRYDDRGVGGSTGSVAQSTTEDFAGDALSGAALLSARPEIDRARIGVFGHSEGADVAAIAATKAPDRIAFIIMMAGTAISGDVVTRTQAEDSARALGGTPDEVAAVVAAHKRATGALRANAPADELAQAVRDLVRAQLLARPAAMRAAIPDLDAFIEQQMPAAMAQFRVPWLRYFMSFDPAPVLAQVKCPVYALFGEKDTQVRPDLNKAPLEAAFARGGNTRVTVKVYPQANHLFLKAVTGQVMEYPTLEKTFVPGLLDDLGNWIQTATRTR